MCTTPLGAAVFVDGVSLGNTPLLVREVPPGLHWWKVQVPSADPQGGAVEVSSSRQAKVHAQMASTDPESKILATLAQNKIDPLRPETRLLPGETQRGRVIVNFPVNQQAFDQRKSLKVVINLYDHSVPVKIQQ